MHIIKDKRGKNMKIASVIKYEGDNTTFIWKHPIEDFNTKTQLIVHESQEAIFFMNGQALDSFGPGRHTLQTENIPFIRQFYHFITGDEPFHCEVYFINKACQMAIRWGTDSKIQYLEPEYGFPVEIGACGEMALQVREGRKLLLKLVGTGNIFSREELIKVFRAFLMVKIKPYIANLIKEKKISIFEIDGQLDMMSSELLQMLAPDFAEYGLQLDKFFLTSILKPNGERTFERFKELHFRKYADVAEAELKQQVELIDQTTEAKKRVIEAQSIAQKRQIEGYTYQEERSFDVNEKMVQNEGIGEFTSAGIGIGLISGIGNSVGNIANTIFTPALQSTQETKGTMYCKSCGFELSKDMAFCINCGEKVEKNESISCSKCGYTFSSNGKFCPKCGQKREDI